MAEALQGALTVLAAMFGAVGAGEGWKAWRRRGTVQRQDSADPASEAHAEEHKAMRKAITRVSQMAEDVAFIKGRFKERDERGL